MDFWNNHINFLFQALTLLVLTPFFVMTIGKITMPTLFHENFHTTGCQVFNTMVVTHMTLTISCGFNMALYRMFCMKGKRLEVKYFVASTLTLVFFVLITFFSINEDDGWETNVAYQYCTDFQTKEAENPQQIHDKGINMKKILTRSTPNVSKVIHCPA